MVQWPDLIMCMTRYPLALPYTCVTLHLRYPTRALPYS